MNAPQTVFLVSALASLVFVLVTCLMAYRSRSYDGEKWILPGVLTMLFLSIYSAWAMEVFV